MSCCPVVFFSSSLSVSFCFDRAITRERGTLNWVLFPSVLGVWVARKDEGHSNKKYTAATQFHFYGGSPFFAQKVENWISQGRWKERRRVSVGWGRGSGVDCRLKDYSFKGREGYFAEREIKIKIKKVRETIRSLSPLIFAGIDLEAMQNPQVTQHPSSSSFSSSLMQEEKKRRALVTEPKMCFKKSAISLSSERRKYSPYCNTLLLCMSVWKIYTAGKQEERNSEMFSLRLPDDIFRLCPFLPSRLKSGKSQGVKCGNEVILIAEGA